MLIVCNWGLVLIRFCLLNRPFGSSKGGFLFAESPLLARPKGAFCLLNRPFLFVQTVQANGQIIAGA